MSDLFHPGVPDEFIDRVFTVMALCPQHAFQILTKRPERMLEYCKGFDWDRIVSPEVLKFEMSGGDPDVTNITEWPLPNVCLGVSIEDQTTANKRIPLLLQTPAAVRFASCEPMIGRIDLTKLGNGYAHRNALTGLIDAGPATLMRDFLPCLDWVIVGGESGPCARPMHAAWAQSLCDQCQDAGVPFFFKQWGEWLPAMQDGAQGKDPIEINASDAPIRVGKKSAGRLLDGREWSEFPK